MSKANLPFEIRLGCLRQAQAPSTSRGARRSLRFACFKIDKAQRQQYWTFDVGRSMFDVQSVYCSNQAQFHTSTAAGLTRET